jgi:hypothetical protein
MYLAYKIDEDCGQSYIEPIGILKDNLDLKKFENISDDREIQYEKVNMIDLNNIKPIVYIDFVYRASGETTYKKIITNTLLTTESKCNNAYTFNDSVHITKVLKTEDDIDVVAKKLKKISHNFLFGKSIEELKTSDELGIRTNSLYVKIDANDLFDKLL